MKFESKVLRRLPDLYIFDIDGTLADISHRLYFIEGEQKDWQSFYLACSNDKPIESTILQVRALHNYGADIWFWTGRSDIAEQQTLAWLTKSIAREWSDNRNKLCMRKEGDHRPDHELKKTWLEAIDQSDRDRLVAIFEDRSRVVQMWRSLGIPCFQVADGDF